MTRLFPLALCVALSACAPSSPPAYLFKAADPQQRIRAPVIANAAEGTRTFMPVEAGDWEKINRAIAPKAGAK